MGGVIEHGPGEVVIHDSKHFYFHCKCGQIFDSLATVGAHQEAAAIAAKGAGMKFRKKPVVIEAVLWQRDSKGVAYIVGNDDAARFLGADYICIDDKGIHIKTLEGEHIGSPGDWLIRGVKGEHYACKPDIFDLTYEPVG